MIPGRVLSLHTSMRFRLQVLLPAASLLLGACGNIGYYSHLAEGQVALLSARVPISTLIADPATDPALRERLRKLQHARRWAAEHLRLPDNGSYTSYADLGRPYVVWNVFATQELSLAPVEHCFPVAGCLAYRGYFEKERAEAHAERLRKSGHDVHVGGVPAYSSLGWFDDPVTNTMMRWADEQLVGILFHELAHQQLYIKSDTVFNESFAEFVEERGLEQYLQAQGGASDEHAQRKSRRNQFVQLILSTRGRLDALYKSGISADGKRTEKARILRELHDSYLRLKTEAWGGYTGYDPWFEEGVLNNAKLLPFGLYDEYMPAFAALFRQERRDWARFYTSAKLLSELDAGRRSLALSQLKAQGLAEK